MREMRTDDWPDRRAERIDNVVLVHGAFVDGSGWEPVYGRLAARGYRVSVVQYPATSLADDVAATRATLDLQDGPVVLVGHGYGGVVITEAGLHPKVRRLVYVAAFAPDAGESVQRLGARPAFGAPVPPMLAPVDGYLRLDAAQFAGAYAAGLAPGRAAFLARAQRPWALAAFTGTVATPAWRAKPSWYLVATADRMIPPGVQRAMAARADAVVTETASCHAVQEACPDAVAAHIETAALGRGLRPG